MNLLPIINSRAGVALALTLGKAIPPRFGYPVADLISNIIAGRNTEMTRAIRANQWVVSDGKLSGKKLDEAVKAVLQNNAHSLYDYYHNLDRPEEIIRLVSFSEKFNICLEERRQSQKGTIFVVPHMSNFDLAGLALALHGVSFQVLSFPQPNVGYQLQNQIRAARGIEVTPMSIAAMRQARKRLSEGGIVLTGLDRPITDTAYLPRFFGRPAPVPVAYIRLALQEDAPVVVVACMRQNNGKYYIDASQPVYMQRHPDLHTELIQNAETILAEAEIFIRKAPDQWSMFYPVWPDALAEIK
jgi:lauroyl/myristoyl acyltransferase